jgi:glycine dehydrogenase subunit 2
MSERLLIELSKPGRKAYSFPPMDLPRGFEKTVDPLPADLVRTTKALLPEVSELDVVRHFTRLSNLSYGVDEGIDPLGACTMKYNPKVSETVDGIPSLTQMHPMQDTASTQGCLSLMYNLLEDLSSITGMRWGTLQACSALHGTCIGLNVIRAWLRSQNQTERNTVLVSDVASPAESEAAKQNGFVVRVVKTTPKGQLDRSDLSTQLDASVAAVVLSNPNALGLFETETRAIATLVHQAGGKLYYDGVNFNALMGMATVRDMGFDLVHLDLQKTFAAPHGGGGPGAGAVLVSDELVPFLPKPDIVLTENTYALDWTGDRTIGKSCVFWGNFLVLAQAYVYILRMGSDGLRAASAHAVLNANYLLSLLKDQFDLPFGDRCMHQFVVSCKSLKERYGISARDIAMALIERGYHPPTLGFPASVEEALVFEPTESESVETLDKLAKTIKEIIQKAVTDPAWIHGCPHHTVVGRLDGSYGA